MQRHASTSQLLLSPGIAEQGFGMVFENVSFEADLPHEGIAAELQAALLRLEAVESEKGALRERGAWLEEQLAGREARLHDALEVLEGVLNERSALLRRTRELQDQLAVVLEGQRCSRRAAASSDGSLERVTPREHLRQELQLAQAQLGELRSAQQAWEGERQLLLLELEDERQCLQEELVEALTHASCAQRDADAAAERAAHWCSLAQWLQRSALLPDSPAPAPDLDPASPASLASLPSPAGDDGKPRTSVSRCGSCNNEPGGLRHGGSQGSPGMQAHAAQLSGISSYGEAPGAVLGATVDPSTSLIAAFHAVAASDSAEQLQGSPMLQRYQPSAQLQSVPSADKLAGGDTTMLAASADLAPGSHLSLLHRLPTPGLSFASSVDGGPSPLLATPSPFVAHLGAVPASPPSTGSPATIVVASMEGRSLTTTLSEHQDQQEGLSSSIGTMTDDYEEEDPSVSISLSLPSLPCDGTLASQEGGAAVRPRHAPAKQFSFLSRLLCMVHLPAGQEAEGRRRQG